MAICRGNREKNKRSFGIWDHQSCADKAETTSLWKEFWGSQFKCFRNWDKSGGNIYWLRICKANASKWCRATDTDVCCLTSNSSVQEKRRRLSCNENNRGKGILQIEIFQFRIFLKSEKIIKPYGLVVQYHNSIEPHGLTTFSDFNKVQDLKPERGYIAEASKERVNKTKQTGRCTSFQAFCEDGWWIKLILQKRHRLRLKKLYEVTCCSFAYNRKQILQNDVQNMRFGSAA